MPFDLIFVRHYDISFRIVATSRKCLPRVLEFPFGRRKIRKNVGGFEAVRCPSSLRRKQLVLRSARRSKLMCKSKLSLYTQFNRINSLTLSLIVHRSLHTEITVLLDGKVKSFKFCLILICIMLFFDAYGIKKLENSFLKCRLHNRKRW